MPPWAMLLLNPKDISKENTSAYPIPQKNAVLTLNLRPLAPLHNEPHTFPNILIHIISAAIPGSNPRYY